MTNFSIKRPIDYISLLIEQVPVFGESEEYIRLDPEDRRCPGLVFSAFARFMERSGDDTSRFNPCIDAVEFLATMADSEAENLLVTEVFESLFRPELIAPRL